MVLEYSESLAFIFLHRLNNDRLFLEQNTHPMARMPTNKDGEDLPRGTSLRRGGEGWRARRFLKERRGRMARIILDARKFLASRKFLEIRMAIEEIP